MIVFIVGIALFLTAFEIHVALWRIHVPKRQGRMLAVIFLVVLVAGVGLLLSPAAASIGSDFSLPRLVLTLLFYGSLCTVYFIVFTAVEADSPTLTMIELIFRCREQGIGREDLLRQIELHSFSRLRLDQLLRDGMVIVDGERLRPTHKGRVVIDLILAYRRLLGRTQTGG
jgi:hypothetical protein